MLKFAAVLIVSLCLVQVCRSEEEKPCFDETKELPAKMEWNRDVNVKNPCSIDVVLICPNKKSLIVVADRTYQALLKGDKEGMKKEDFICMKDLDAGETRTTVSFPSGHFWFIIQNVGEKASMQMKWFEVPADKEAGEAEEKAKE